MLTCGLSRVQLQRPENKTEELEKNSFSFRKETTLPFPELFISVLDKTPSIFTQVGLQMICFQLHSSGTLTHMVLSVTPPREAFRDHQREGSRGTAAREGREATLTSPQLHSRGAAVELSVSRQLNGPPTVPAPAHAHRQPRPTHQGLGAPRVDQRGLPDTFSFQMSSNIEINVKDGRKHRRN